MGAHKDPVYSTDKIASELKKVREMLEALVILLEERLPKVK